MPSRRYRSNNSTSNKIEEIDYKTNKNIKAPRSPHGTENTVTAVDLAPGATETEAIADEAVTGDKIARGAVGTNELGLVNTINSDSNILFTFPPEGTFRVLGTKYPNPTVVGDAFPLGQNSDGSVTADFMPAGAMPGQIDPYWTFGQPKVNIMSPNNFGVQLGSTTAISWVSGYTPTSGQVVMVVRRGSGVHILGAYTTTVPYLNQFDIPLSNSWVHYGAPWPTARATKTSTGLVKVTGLLTSGVITYGAIIATLPEGFRPSPGIHRFPASNGGVWRSVEVWDDGTIRVGPSFANNTYVNLDHILFHAADSVAYTPVSTYSSTWGPQGGSFAAPAYYRDPVSGQAYMQGTAASSSGSALANTSSILTIPTTHRPPNGRTAHNVNSAADAEGYYYAQLSDTGIAYGLHASNRRTIYSFAGGTWGTSDAGWTNLGFTNGWLNYDTSGYPPASYKVIDGLVYMRGLIRAGTVGQVALTLPAGARPATSQLRLSITNTAQGRTDIGPTGALTPLEGSNVWYSLDGISFAAGN